MSEFIAAALPENTSTATGLPRTDHLIQPDVPKRSQHCRNIAVRQAGFDGQRAAITDELLLAGEPLPDDGEQIIWQVGDIGDGLGLDL